MAYRIDDEENRYQDLKDKVDQLEIQTFSPEVVSRNQSTRNTGIQGKDSGVDQFPGWAPIRDVGSIGPSSQVIFLDIPSSRYSKYIVTGTTDIGFINPPFSVSQAPKIIPTLPQFVKFTVDITQDGAGGHAVTFPVLTYSITPTPVVNTGANKRTILEFQTIDKGVTFQLLSTLVI